jgi:hypothetical protein
MPCIFFTNTCLVFFGGGSKLPISPSVLLLVSFFLQVSCVSGSSLSFCLVLVNVQALSHACSGVKVLCPK